MPRVAAFRTAALEDLFTQLRYAPPTARLKHMERAEDLLTDIDPDRTYPGDFLIFRITEYRPDHREEPTLLPGTVIIADLINLIQRLSQGLDIHLERGERPAIRADSIPGRLGVSAKTIQRWRPQGLVFHYLIGADGVKRLSCYEDALQRFLDKQSDRVTIASTFSRLGDAMEEDIIHEATQIHLDNPSVSLNGAAKSIAKRHRRSHETIRGVLKRSGVMSSNPMTDKELRVISRAARLGIPPLTLMKRYGRSRSTIQRIIIQSRAETLLSFLPHLKHIPLPTFNRPDAAEIIFSSPRVRSRLAITLPEEDALDLLIACREGVSLDPEDVVACTAALNLLKMQAAHTIETWLMPRGGFPPNLSAAAVDRVETDLRWATLLLRRLVSFGLPAAIRAAEQHFHRPLVDQSRNIITTTLFQARDVVLRVVEAHDPGPLNIEQGIPQGGQQLERLCAQAMDRALAQDTQKPISGGARARHETGSIKIPGLFRNLTPWENVLSLSHRIIPKIPHLSPVDRSLIENRWGLNHTAPQTLAELAAAHHSTPAWITRRLDRIRQQLR